MNLENLNLVKLNSQELENIDGGSWLDWVESVAEAVGYTAGVIVGSTVVAAHMVLETIIE